MSPASDILYRPRGKLRNTKAGAHRSVGFGTFGSFKDVVPFVSYPDARRIDLRATIQSPFEEIFVRRFEQRASIDVYAVIDLSRSLSFEGQSKKAKIISDLCAALARSVRRNGDRFGLMACGSEINEDLTIPASNRRAIEQDVASRLEGLSFDAPNADGLADVAEKLAGKRKLIFLISDFLLPDSFLEKILESLHTHDVIPVSVKDSAEDSDLPDLGFFRVNDLETNETRLVFMRPSLKREWIRKAADHGERVNEIAKKRGRALIVLRDAFDAERFSQAIMES